MTIEELQKQIIDLQTQLQGVTTQLAQKDELLEGFKQKEEAHLSKATEYQEQIMRLRDMNTELFLKVSQPIGPQDPIEPVEKGPSQEETITLNDILG